MNIKSYSIYLLNKKAYTKQELKKKLIKKKFSNKEIDNILEEFSKKHFINDYIYVKNFIKNQIENLYKSPKEIAYKLKKKEVEYELLLKKIYTEKEEIVIINKLINKYLRIEKISKEKIIKKLARKGFCINLILISINKKNI